MEQLSWLDGRPEVAMKQIRRLAERLVDGAGDSSSELRRAVVGRSIGLAGGKPTAGEEIPAVWRPYVDKVSLYAYKVLDQDVADLKKAGQSEEQIFEVTLAAGLGASLGRLEKAFDLLDREAS